MKPLTAVLLALAISRSDPARPKWPPPHACEPYAEVCTACKDCSACKHCHQLGGKCSVCFKK